MNTALRFLLSELPSLAAGLGLGLLSFGCALVYGPLGLIVPGAALFLLPAAGVWRGGR